MLIDEEDDKVTEEEPSEFEAGDQGAEDESSVSKDDESKGSDEGKDEEEKGELVVAIGEEESPSDEQAPGWVRDLRKNFREQQKENRNLKQQIEQLSGTGDQPVALGEKPTLEGSDYDSDVFEKNLDAWHELKSSQERQQEELKRTQAKEQEAWQSTVNSYAKGKDKLKERVNDYDEAEAAVQDVMSEMQQGTIMHVSDDPALVVFALGKNPKRAKALSKIRDPAKFVFALAKVEAQLKVKSKRAVTSPEKIVKGNGTAAAAGDSTLDKLRADAERTGDISRVHAYKMQQRQAGK